MTKIFFFSPSGYAPMKDSVLRGMLHQSHGWQADGAPWVFGVCIPAHGVDPINVTDQLTALGALPLPSVHDSAAQPHPTIVAALAQFGVTPGDKGLDVARKMFNASGNRALRPCLY